MYVVTLIVDDQVIATNHSHHPMAKTLRLAWAGLAGIPQAECCIRREGNLEGYLHTNFRGELDEAEVYSRRQASHTLVTALNPLGPIFADVVVGREPIMCGGCGETDPAQRCIGCLHDFGV